MPSVMHFTPFELLRYGGAIALEAGVFGLALYRGLQRRFRLFAVYFGVLLVTEIARWVPIFLWGLASKQAFWTYWVTQILLIGFRGAFVFEICHYVLSPYRGVWSLCKAILASVAGLVVVSALLTPEQGTPYVVRVGLAERGLELAILAVLLFALVFCRYYRIPVDRLSGLLGFGVGLFAAVQVINDTFVSHWFRAYHPIWREIRLDAFLVTLVIWLAALWKPLPVRAQAPVMLDAGVYSAITPQLTDRLRQLNARLEETLK
jgi:hypothetical protein